MGLGPVGGVEAVCCGAFEVGNGGEVLTSALDLNGPSCPLRMTYFGLSALIGFPSIIPHVLLLTRCRLGEFNK